MHTAITPRILYFGTPVVLVSTLNPDGTPNLAAISSAWALGWTLVLGMGMNGQTMANLRRHPECVLSLPDASLWPAVERLAPLTGRNPVPDHVAAYGGRHEPRKFEAAGLTPLASECVRPPRVAECPLHLEARVRHVRALADEPGAASVEARVVRVHAAPSIVAGTDHIDPAAWHPLIYSFRRYFGLGPELGRSFREAT